MEYLRKFGTEVVTFNRDDTSFYTCTKNEKTLCKWLEDQSVKQVYYCAGSVNLQSRYHDFRGEIATLFQFHKIIFRCCKKLNIKQAYYSSAGALYPENILSKEDDFVLPRSYYSLLKFRTEQLLLQIDQGAIIFRITNPYGMPALPKGRTQGVIDIFINRAYNREPITLFTPTTILRNYIYIDDLNFVVSRLVEENCSGIFNIGSDTHHSIDDVVSEIEGVTEHHFAKLYKQSLLHRKNILIDISRLRAYIPELQCTNLSKAVSNIWQSYVSK